MLFSIKRIYMNLLKSSMEEFSLSLRCHDWRMILLGSFKIRNSGILPCLDLSSSSSGLLVVVDAWCPGRLVVVDAQLMATTDKATTSKKRAIFISS